MTSVKAGVYFFSTKEKTKDRSINSVSDQPEEEKFAITLAKAHLDTEMTDYVILGFNRRAEPIELIEYYNVGSEEALGKLYELFLERAEPK